MRRVRSLVRWRHAVREIAFIVVGVLIALAGNAWWQGREERGRERSYTVQLLADVRENERILREAVAVDSASAHGAMGLLAAIDRPGRPPADSLRGWMQRPPGWYSDPRPRLGTVNTLLQTGDVRLLRSARLRSALVGYASQMEQDAREADRAVDLLLSSGLALASRYHAAGIPVLFSGPDGRYPEARLRAWLPSFVAGWPRLQADPRAHDALVNGAVGYFNRVAYLQSMLEATTRLGRELERGEG